MKKTFIVLMCLAFISSLALMRAPAGNAATIIQWNYNVTANVNETPFTATGRLILNDETGISEGNMSFSSIPPGLDLFAAGCSWFCISCCNGNKVTRGAVNIVTVTGGNYNAARTLTITRWDGTTVGKLTINATISKISETSYNVNEIVTGWYNGPTDLVSIGSYTMKLWQESSGKIKGSYSQCVRRSPLGNNSISIYADTEYTYSGTNTLPFEEEVEVKFLSVSKPGTQYIVQITGEYRPVTVGGINIAVDKLGLLAPYIGFASTIAVAAVATAFYTKRVRRRKDEQ